MKARTIADDNRAMKFLLDWCKSENIPPFLETFGRREAARFTDAFPELIGTKQPRTLNKYVHRLGAYWKWLVNRDEIQLNVWEGRSYTVPPTTDAERERTFTDAEVLKLLNGDASPAMHDLMRVAALTGARLEAVVGLTAGECQNGTFVFQPQKKEASRRLCPIHPDLKEIVERRTNGREEGDRIFPEWPSPKSDTSQHKHSTRASNEFTAYRRRVGVDDVREGNRRSKVNFHSFRRWFITKAEQADQPVTLIAAVVGHKREGMTLGVYSAGPKLEQARRCVEAVKLPVSDVVDGGPD